MCGSAFVDDDFRNLLRIACHRMVDETRNFCFAKVGTKEYSFAVLVESSASGQRNDARATAPRERNASNSIRLR
jgi:hypothetical protein